MTTRVAFLLAVLAVVCTGSAEAKDWPEFRGPTGQGLATAHDLPAHWSKTQNVAWRTPLPGEGWSSPVLYEGRLYLTAAVPEPDSAKEYSLPRPVPGRQDRQDSVE